MKKINSKKNKKINSVKKKSKKLTPKSQKKSSGGLLSKKLKRKNVLAGKSKSRSKNSLKGDSSLKSKSAKHKINSNHFSDVLYSKENTDRVARVLIAKPGLDGHDRGAKVVARGLRDEGFEVIYTGLHQTPDMIVQAALQEDVDMIGLSILSGAHLPLVKAVLDLMKKNKIKKPVFVGGIIPGDDSAKLKKMGVCAVFGPGSTIGEISREVKAQIAKRI